MSQMTGGEVLVVAHMLEQANVKVEELEAKLAKADALAEVTMVYIKWRDDTCGRTGCHCTWPGKEPCSQWAQDALAAYREET